MDVVDRSLLLAGALIAGAALVGGILRWRLGAQIPARWPVLAHAFTIWSHPRSTVQRALERGSLAPTAAIVALSGVLDSWVLAFRFGPDEGLGLLGTLLLGAAGPWISLGFFALQALLGTVFGNLLGGSGRPRELLIATVHPALISIWVDLFCLPSLFAPGPSEGWGMLELAGIFLQGTSAVWTFGLLVPALSAAHGFSSWRAAATLALGTATVLALALCVILLAAVALVLLG